MNNQKTINSDIRTAAEKAGVKLWQIADKLGVHHCTFSVWLRKELGDELKNQIMNAIAEIAEEQG